MTTKGEVQTQNSCCSHFTVSEMMPLEDNCHCTGYQLVPVQFPLSCSLYEIILLLMAPAFLGAGYIEGIPKTKAWEFGQHIRVKAINRTAKTMSTEMPLNCQSNVGKNAILLKHSPLPFHG